MKTFKSFGVHLNYLHIEGKHSEPWYNICCGLYEVTTTPDKFEACIMICDVVIMLVSA